MIWSVIFTFPPSAPILYLRRACIYFFFSCTPLCKCHGYHAFFLSLIPTLSPRGYPDFFLLSHPTLQLPRGILSSSCLSHPALRLPRGLSCLFPACHTPHCNAPWAYPDFFCLSRPALRLPRGLSCLFLLLNPDLAIPGSILFPPQVPTQAISMRIDIHCQGSVIHGAIPGHPGVL